MMEHLGFPVRWVNWIRNILGSGSSAVLLNGVPGKFFRCKRGVRQGDPLSPLLFVLAAELLQVLINRAAAINLLKAPIPQPINDFPIVQYADDMLLIMQADACQLFFLKSLLNSFAESTGLKVNYRKSSMLPINVPPKRMQCLASTLGCSIGTLPFTYLGLPMGKTKSRMEDLTPMMDRIERRLSGLSTWLSYSGRLQMLNSAITPITTYVPCTIKLPKGVIENIDRARKQCLWCGNSEQIRGGNLVAWQIVQQPKEKGGLGVINLSLQNDALLLKHLHKFYNKADVPWVQLIWFRYYSSKVPHAACEVGSFWWKDVLRLNNLYRIIGRYTVGDGSTVTFWGDQWSGTVLKLDYPRLASYSRSDAISVLDVMQAKDLDSIFFLPLSHQALQELEQLQTHLQNTPYDENSADCWVPIWGNEYTSKKFYSYVFRAVDAHPIFQLMWKSRCTPRIKFFVWLVLVDRLNTKTMLTRRHLAVHDDDLCVMCETREEETIEHLFFTCPFASQCWATLNFVWDHSLNLQDRFIQARQAHGHSFFTEASMIAAWEIWKMRNGKVFDRREPSQARWICNLKINA
jgi:hypothetical protein